MSMTREQMLRYIDEPSVLNERTLGELREILDEYPYFQTAHLLYIRNLQAESNFRFSGQLKICALYSSDRTILYHLLNSGPEKKQVGGNLLEISSVSTTQGQSMIELSDESTEHSDESEGPMISVIRPNPAGTGHFDLLNFELSEKTYSLEGVENDSEKPLSELVKEITHMSAKKGKEKEADQKADLIDRFIKDNPAFTIKQFEKSEIGERSDKQIDNVVEKDEFITETLARIYVNQGLYHKAIKAFEKLSLKYPEKSVYFARQIEEVTNLLNK